MPRFVDATSDVIDLVLSFLTPVEAICKVGMTCRHLHAVEGGTAGHVAQWNSDFAVDAYRARTGEGPAVSPRAAFLHFARDHAMLQCGYLHGRITHALATFEAAMARLGLGDDNPFTAGMPGPQIEEAWSASSWARALGIGCPAGVKTLYTVLRPNGKALGMYRVYDIAARRVFIPFNQLVTFADGDALPSVLPVIVEALGTQQGIALFGARIDSDEEGRGRIVPETVALRSLHGPGLRYECHLPPGWPTTGDPVVDVALEWLEGVAAENHAVMRDPMVDRPYLDVFPSAPYDPRVQDANTDGIVVRTSALILHCVSSPHRTLCAYQVRICMATGHSERRARLRTRSWEVMRNGTVESTVQGEGVIGFYPVLAPVDASIPRGSDGLPLPSASHFSDDSGDATSGWFVYASLTSVDLPRGETVSSL
eukprot:CAMPEP_0174839400 /NCGR_PEP_ID=MMETSP1114-20130205/8012_1 /TAXON_ID=312471 /ORGANISM="Neobodo designis, Strain CCAP 1951/1" /LENGTH=424 /DNA_ID=CAMNT_0016073521 /DNA_START=37 /DNA_END=1308 /DNA_ORIENTATION=+